MLKVFRIISVLSVLTLSACGGSSSGGGGSSSSTDAINDGYQNYSNGVLMAGAQRFIDPPENPVATSQYTSYYNCLANFLEDYMDEPFAYSQYHTEGFDEMTRYCCTDSHFSVNLSSDKLRNVFRQGLNVSRHKDIVDQVIVSRENLDQYLDIHFSSDMRRALDGRGTDNDILNIKRSIITATKGESRYTLGSLEQVIQDKIQEVTSLKREAPFLSHRANVFLEIYYPNLTEERVVEKDFCDIDVNTLSLTDLGKSRFSSNQAVFCTSTREALAAITSLALWDQGKYSGLCQVNIDENQYQSLSPSQHSQFKRCIEKKGMDENQDDPLYHTINQLQGLDFRDGYAGHYGGYIDSCCSDVSSDHQILVKAENPIRVMDDAKNEKFTFTYQPYTFNQFSTERLSLLHNSLASMWPINKSCVLEKRALKGCLNKHCPKESSDYASCMDWLYGSYNLSECFQNLENYARCVKPNNDLLYSDKKITDEVRKELDDFISDMCQVRIGN